MTLIKETKRAFEKALARENSNIRQLSQKTKLAYSIVHELKNGVSKFGNMRLGTFESLFPELRVYFFRDEYPEAVRNAPPPVTDSAPAETLKYERRIVDLEKELLEKDRRIFELEKELFARDNAEANSRRMDFLNPVKR